MKRIKSFKLFESVDPKFDMLDALEDIKSIEYIVEEDGYQIHYEFIFKVENDIVIEVMSEDSVRDSIEKNIPLGQFVGFRINISYQRDKISRFTGGKPIFTSEQIEKINNDCERYCNLFKEHMDYAISVQSYTRDGKNFIVVKL